MTQTEIRDYIASLDGSQLEALRRAIVQQEQEVYEKSFYLHEHTDGYIYIIHYRDGSEYMDYLGKRAYDRYISEPDAISIERKTKDLFPVYEQLLSKERKS